MATNAVEVTRIVNGQAQPAVSDVVAVEEPLEIRLGFTLGSERLLRTLSVTMRTPGHDRELACGLLFAEGVVNSPADIAAILDRPNLIRIELKPGVSVDWPRLERHLYTSSSCGLCSASCVEAVQARRKSVLQARTAIRPSVLSQLPQALRKAQQTFNLTGGLHASALFGSNGELEMLREDVGRHNALDKVIGAAFLRGRLPLSDRILLLSGRASFELIQKAYAAGIPVAAAIGAPSSLAVELAQEIGMTLAGFLRADSFNIYSGSQRIREAA